MHITDNMMMHMLNLGKREPLFGSLQDYNSKSSVDLETKNMFQSVLNRIQSQVQSHQDMDEHRRHHFENVGQC